MKTLRSLFVVCTMSLFAGCGPTEAGVTPADPDAFGDREVLDAVAEDEGVPFDTVEQGIGEAFGIAGTVPSSRVKLTVILADELYKPTSLAFQNGVLWIVDRGDDSSIIVDNPGKTTQRVSHFYDDSAHFMNNPTQIAFSRTKNEFAVSLDSVNDYNGRAPANLFTGVTLFTANRNDYEGGTQSHLDMLHHSPRSMGVAAGARPSTGAPELREFWVFNGYAGSIDRYFFRTPHPLGADDHSDGITVRYAKGQVARSGEIPSHLAFDTSTRQLYIADTGNGRIARLDTRPALTTARRISAYHNETPLYELPSQSTVTVVSGLSKPSGLLVKSSQLVVGEQGTGKIKVYSTAGTLKGELSTGLGAGALGGLAEGPDGKLWLLDAKLGRVLRLDLL